MNDTPDIGSSYEEVDLEHELDLILNDSPSNSESSNLDLELDNLSENDFIVFEPEENLDNFNTQKISGDFEEFSKKEPSIYADEVSDWDIGLINLSSYSLNYDTSFNENLISEADFLKVGGTGRKSEKLSKIRKNTFLSVARNECFRWAKKFIEKGYYEIEDVDNLISVCEGADDRNELRDNINRCLEYSGINYIYSDGNSQQFLSYRIKDLSLDDLAESLDALLNRCILLPGTKRFTMDKSKDYIYFNPLLKAKQELLLCILKNEQAIKYIFDVMDEIFNGERTPENFSLKNIYPSRPEHLETSEIIEAYGLLRIWLSNGMVLDGKSRRLAIEALESIDMPLSFYKELLQHLEIYNSNSSLFLSKLIFEYEAVANELLVKHLPFARRFSSRNTNSGEDPEDVFQVAFTGLQRSLRRFDPERGNRFTTYCTFWMYQAITRWRSDEGALIRIPVHRQNKLAKIDELLDLESEQKLTDGRVATLLEWPVKQVYEYSSFPRKAIYLENLEDWDVFLPSLEEDIYNQEVIQEVVTEVLAELNEREANVIRLRFGIDCENEMTLEEIGGLYGVTRERIRQIEAKGLKRLALPKRIYDMQQKLGY
jgi:RNA polymerase primary sigma factor